MGQILDSTEESFKTISWDSELKILNTVYLTFFITIYII